jgi:ethanolamine utilization cobalamin adenosyltransferase
MVPKTHGRIAFRGIIDTLEAEVIEAQVLALELGEGEILGSLGEILDYLRALMAAEVKEMPLPPPFLFGLDAEEIHRQTHDPERSAGPALLPAYTQGPLAARINTLRAKTREAELLGIRVFGPGEKENRDDIILALNRLSSAFWWLFCKYVSRIKGA